MRCQAEYMANVERVAAKVLLVTAELDVLLFSSVDPGDPSRPGHWFAVGGGVEHGETLEEAAVREVFEETGLRLFQVGSPLFTRHVAFDFEGDQYEQDETYFVAWVERFTPSTEGWTELEHRTVAGHRWWSVEELARTDATVYPEQLVELLWNLRGRGEARVAGMGRVERGHQGETFPLNTYVVRPARTQDSQTIQLIERRAGERFREVGLPEVADDSPEPIATLDHFAAEACSFVVVDEVGNLVGYVLVEQIDGAAFVHQVNVLPEDQGRGLGRRLLDAVDGWARKRKLDSITLTTFDRHVPWNRPLYEHLGFRVMVPSELGPSLRTIQAAEAARGLQRRVAMIRPVRSIDVERLATSQGTRARRSYPEARAPAIRDPSSDLVTDIVVFDLGGVVCHFRPERRLATLATETGLDTSEIEHAIWSSGLDHRADSGDLTEGETIEAVLQALDHRLDEPALIRAWSQAFAPNAAVLDIASRVSAHRYVFTNNGPLLPLCLGPGVTEVFERVICSYELRARKPDLLAFERLAAELRSEPTTVTFIDDDSANCRSAEVAGFRVLHFMGAESLESDLARAGLLAT